MKTLYIEQKAMKLRYERACLLIYRDGKRISSVPLVQLERIVVAPHVSPSAGVLGLVAEHEVALLVVNHRFPESTASLSGMVKTDVHRRLQKYKCHHDTSFRLHWAVQLMRLKTLRRLRFLHSLRQQCAAHRHALTQAIRSIEALLPTFHQDQIKNLATLRGKEGRPLRFILKPIPMCLRLRYALASAIGDRRAIRLMCVFHWPIPCIIMRRLMP